MMLDMQPGMYSSLEVLRLDLPRHLERLGVGTSLCLRHPGDALNLRLLLLRRRSLNPSSWTRFMPHKKSPDPPRGFFGDSGLSSLYGPVRFRGVAPHHRPIPPGLFHQRFHIDHFLMGVISFQFRVLCLGLTTATYVFTRLLASIRSLPEPPRNEGVFGNRSLVPPGGRRLPSQLLVGLGGGRLGSGGTAGWLSDPLRPSTSSIRASTLPAGVLPTVHQGSRLNPGASKPSSEGGSRASPTVSGFLQRSLPRPEGFGVVAPHHRSVDPERIHHLVTLPHGDSSVSPEFHPPRRLEDLPGPAGRIPSGSSASRFASLPSLRGSREALPVQGPLFRSYNRASSLHEDYGTSVRHPPQARGQDASLPGRLAHPGLYGNRLHSVMGQAPISLHRTWHPGQPHEVVSGSLSVPSVLRHGDSVSAFYCSSHTSTSQQSHSPYRGVLINPVSSSVTLASSSLPPVFSDSSRLWRDDQDEASPTLPQGPVGLHGRSVPGLLVPSPSRGPSLVVESGSAERGSESLFQLRTSASSRTLRM